MLSGYTKNRFSSWILQLTIFKGKNCITCKKLPILWKWNVILSQWSSDRTVKSLENYILQQFISLLCSSTAVIRVTSYIYVCIHNLFSLRSAFHTPEMHLAVITLVILKPFFTVKYTKKCKQCFSALALLSQDFNSISWWTCCPVNLFGKKPSFVFMAKMRIVVKNYLPCLAQFPA